MLSSHEPGRHHVRAVSHLLICETRRNRRQVRLRAVYMEIFGEIPILHVRELPPAEHLGTLRGVTAQTVLALITGRDGVDCDSISLTKSLHGAAQFVNDPHGLMAQGQVGAFTDRPADRMDIGRTDECGGRLDNGIVWSGIRNWLLHHPHRAELLHDKCFHGLGHGLLLLISGLSWGFLRAI